MVLCAIFFLVPFALRGARMATQHLENNIKDWLPSDFPETKDLEWFGKHFIGERFILLTWPGCTEDEQRYKLFTEKLEREIEPTAEEVAEFSPEDLKHERTRQMGDRLGLFTVLVKEQNNPEKW